MKTQIYYLSVFCFFLFYKWIDFNGPELHFPKTYTTGAFGKRSHRQLLDVAYDSIGIIS